MFEHQLYRRHAIAVAAALCAASASAQTTEMPPTNEGVTQVFVTGLRASLAKAQDLKRTADQVVDSVVSDEIGKMPDANVAEALQRITGVQISRSRGEGDRVQVRGLGQTQTLLNGRSIFTAGKERGVSLQDIPAELLAGADVYKTQTAEQIEGGIGALINLRMRRPFDFAGKKVAGTLKLTYADYVKEKNPEGSVLLSNRWKTEAGEFGALLSVSRQQRDYRADTQELGAPAALADGSGIFAPSGVWHAYETGARERTGVNASFQWRPSRDVEVYFDGAATKLDTKTNTHGIYMSPYFANYSSETNSGNLWPKDPVTAKDGTLVKGTFWGNSLSTSSFIADTQTNTQSMALGGRLNAGDWRITSELGLTKSDYNRLYHEVRLGAYGSEANFTYDLTTKIPSAFPTYKEQVLVNPSQYFANQTLYFGQQNDSDEHALRADAERGIDNSLFTKVKFGFRMTDRSATSTEINTVDGIYNSSATSPIGGLVSGLASQVGPTPFNNLLQKEGAGTYPTQWLVVTNLDYLRNPQAVRSTLGLTVPKFDAGQTFDYSEKSNALYGMLDFETALMGKPVTGNVGLRYIQTKSDRKWQELANGTYSNKRSETTDSNLLPSLNVKWELSDKLLARFAASKVISQPNFDQLTPSLSLNVNDRTGYRGNPALAPLTAKQFDVTLEYYMNPSDYVFGAAFHKKVDGFIQTTASQVVYSGNTYTISTPSNGENGTIKGLEVGYQAFFKNLPGVLKGLGTQANFTYVDSAAPGPLKGQQTQLIGLSKRSFNVMAIYDWQDFAFRLAYNYRGKYLGGTTNYYPNKGQSIAQTPTYVDGYGMVDAYMSYALTKNFKLAIDANNLTRTSRRTTYGVSGLPGARYLDDRRIGISLQGTM